jgi:hypothetical protein
MDPCIMLFGEINGEYTSFLMNFTYPPPFINLANHPYQITRLETDFITIVAIEIKHGLSIFFIWSIVRS